MPIEVDSPLAAGFGAAAGALSGYTQGKQQAAEAKRQAELDRQNAIAFAAAQAHQKYEESREAKGDTIAEADLGLRQAANARDVINAQDQHSQALLDQATAKANLAFNRAMQPILIKQAVLQTQLSRGEISEQKYSIESAQAGAQLSQIRTRIAQQFAVPEERLSMEQTQAGIDSTRANTAATTQATQFGAQEEPIRQAQGRADLISTNLGNVGAARSLGSQSGGGIDWNDPGVKQLSKDSDTALSKWKSQEAAIVRAGNGDVQLPNGGYAKSDDLVDPDDPSKGLQKGKNYTLAPPPEDFSTFASALQSGIDKIRSNPKALHDTIMQIRSDPNMTPPQKAYAERQLRAAITSSSQKGGAPAGGSPFGSSRIVADAASEFGVPPQLLDSIWQQESSRGTNTSSPGNAGRGWFQLDPSSGAPPDVIARAARDPVFASRVAANQLRSLYQQYGSWPKAIAAYNAGSPDSPKGQAYAAQVLGRL